MKRKPEISIAAVEFYSKMKEEGLLNRVSEEFQSLSQGIQNRSSFIQIVQLEQVAFEEKKKLLEVALGDMSQPAREYLAPYLTETGLYSLIDAVDAFLDLFQDNKLEIKSAIPLSDDQLNRIVQAFQKKVHTEYDAVINAVDPDVIGGVSIQTRDFLIDRTLKSKLAQFQKQLKSR